MVDLRTDTERLRPGLREAFRELGFFYLTGRDVPEGLAQRLLAAGRRLFELSAADGRPDLGAVFL
nr:2-oxoglutarate and iron-dependent oxygenase domain-containing protein [Mycobacterium sp.]